VRLAKGIHDIRTVIIIDHEDCGYYSVYYNGTDHEIPSEANTGASALTSYNDLTREQKFLLTSYTLEQVKTYYTTGLGRIDLTTTAGVDFPFSCLGIEIRTFYIYLGGRIVEVGQPAIIED
jgi:hypothetical protein